MGSLPIFKSERTGLNSDPDPPEVSFCLDRQDEHSSSNPVKTIKSGDNYRSYNLAGETIVQPKQSSSSNDVPPKPEVPGKSAFAGELEQEMIAALGLSPTDPHHRRAASTPMSLDTFSQLKDGKRQFTEPLPQPAEIPTGKSAPADKAPNRLPVIPNEPFHVPFPFARGHQPSKSAPEIITPSIRPVLDESPQPPSPPPKDNDNGLAPSQDHRRQPSVSTLGADERAGRTSDEELDRDPPSPLQDAANEVAPEPRYRTVEHSMDDQPSAQAKRRSFMPFYSSGFTSSAEVLESKRKSISGLPPSAPDVQSPLRNEVRYSPGNRSSMLSFGSFGKRSANSKGTRPSTPANGLSQASRSGSPAENGGSTIGRLKDFGRRRRASVGDILSGVQPQGPQAPPGGQRKRFSRISVCEVG